MHANAKPIALTMGDVNGIGPEVLAKALAAGAANDIPLAVYGCPKAYADAAKSVPGAPALHKADTPAPLAAGGIPIIPAAAKAPTREPGQLSAEAGRAAMHWLGQAMDDIEAGRCRALVTGPINKQGIHAAGYTCAGHTDYLADRAGIKAYRMCLFTERFAVVHNTGHLRLRDALDQITPERLAESIVIARDGANRLLQREPRIAVAGLNPHAGEAGAFGREEIEIIAPVIERMRADGIDCHGPVSPDAVFRQTWEGGYDAIVALYHDQGHIPLKLIAMDLAVNVTLGLPYVRTSVDHGTAYDIAGTGRADAGSLIAAIGMADRLSRTQESPLSCA